MNVPHVTPPKCPAFPSSSFLGASQVFWMYGSLPELFSLFANIFVVPLLFPPGPPPFSSVPSLRPSATTACGLVVWIGCWWLPWSLRRTRACGVAQWSAPRQRQSLQFRVLSLSHALGLSEFVFGGSVSQIFGLTEVCFLCISLLFGLNGSTQ